MATEHEETGGDIPAYAKWHGRNGQALNEARRTRYQTDPEYRKAQIEAARATRRRHREGDVAEPTLVTRYIDGVAYRVYRISDVAKLAGLSRQGMIKMEASGLVPPVTFPGVHRLYTEHQAQLIVEAVAALRAHKANSPERKQEFEKQSAKLHNEWSA